jgi:hypothetical protein
MREPSLSLRDHLQALMAEMDKRYQQRFDDQTRAIDAAFAASKEAVTKAEVATESRLQSMNEFRGTIEDQARGKVSKEQFEAFHESATKADEALRELIGALGSRLDRIEGKSTGISSSWGILVAVVGFVGVALAVYTNTR